MKRALIRLLCLAAFAAALTGAVCLALNMQEMWANCAACSIAPSTGDDLALLVALYPDARDLLLQSGLVRAGILCLMACAAFWIERKCLKCEKPS